MQISTIRILPGQGTLSRFRHPENHDQKTRREYPRLVPCTVVQMIGKGLDIGTPFLSTSRAVSGSCETTTSTTGAALTISRWILQLAAWALAALFIAGFTGIVRKT